MVSRCCIVLVLLGAAACADTQDFASGAGPRSDNPSAEPPQDSGVAIRSCDTARDADNCGACGHRCLGGTCLSGVCQPIELARDQTPVALAVTGDDVYFLALAAAGSNNGDAIRRVPVRGGEPSTVTTVPGSARGSLILRGGFLYAAYQDRPSNLAVIGRLPVGGDTFARVVTGSPLGCRPAELTVTSTAVVFTCDIDMPGLFACPLTGCEAAPRTLDPSLLMWRSSWHGLVDVGDAVLAAADGLAGLRRIPLDGSARGACDVEMTQPADQGSALAYDGKSVFVARPGELVQLAPVCGAGRSTVLVKSSRLERPILALNADDVLWGEQMLYDGSILRCPKTGCAVPEVLATGQGFVMDVVATNDAVYWVTTPRIGSSPVPGTVMKLALPPHPSASQPLP